jgi:hypothetical protein
MYDERKHNMKKIYVVLALVLFVWLAVACTVYPVMPQADVDARHTAQAVTPEVLPTATLEPTAIVLATEEAPQVECLIKGNVTAAGEKIFHLPGGVYYDRVKIDFSQGDAWFCTEGEAVQQGFRKSSR